MGTTRLIATSEIEQLLQPRALINAVEDAFRLRGAGGAQPGGVLGVELPRGGFHVKAAALDPERGVFAVKLNGNFPANPATNGMPTIQGLVIVADVATGEPLAVLESGAVTRLRTAASSAVAIAHLARPEGDSVTLIGCGAQGFDQLRFALAVRPFVRITLMDANAGAAEGLVARLEAELGVAATIGRSIAESCAERDVVITCTTARSPILLDRHVASGTLVVAVGADNPHKQELEPALLAHAKVVTDVTVQCAAIGDLHHAIEAGVMRREDVHAELGEVIAGKRPGRESSNERIIFDSTGTPSQDAAAAQLLLGLAAERGAGAAFDFRA